MIKLQNMYASKMKLDERIQQQEEKEKLQEERFLLQQERLLLQQERLQQEKLLLQAQAGASGTSNRLSTLAPAPLAAPLAAPSPAPAPAGMESELQVIAFFHDCLRIFVTFLSETQNAFRRRLFAN